VPVRYAKAVVNGAKLPLTPGTETLIEGEPVRIYLRGAFWGIAVLQEDELAWKAQIVPVDGPEELN
jgi:hypothetical protein